MAIHFGLHKRPHVVLGPKAIEKLKQQVQVENFEWKMADRNHYFDPKDPDASIVLNGGNDLWNDVPDKCSLPPKQRHQGIHDRGKTLLEKLSMDKAVMNEFVQKATVDKRKLCAIHFGQNDI